MCGSLLVPFPSPACGVGPRLLGPSAAMQHMREMIGRVARSQAPVHIFGESGTGKELVAKLIHESGPRRDDPFVPVNCGAMSDESGHWSVDIDVRPSR
jgi:two-component system response regulator PilR (NtrC family)